MQNNPLYFVCILYNQNMAFRDMLASRIPIPMQSIASTSISTINFTSTNLPKCNKVPTDDDQLVNKLYVDSKSATSWLKPCRMFHDFSTGAPPNLVTGNRFISLRTFETFTINNVYERTATTYIETIVVEGMAAYITDDDSPMFANKNIVFNTSNEWSQIAATNPFDQSLNTTNNVEFKSIKATDLINEEGGKRILMSNNTTGEVTSTDTLNVVQDATSTMVMVKNPPIEGIGYFTAIKQDGVISEIYTGGTSMKIGTVVRYIKISDINENVSTNATIDVKDGENVTASIHKTGEIVGTSITATTDGIDVNNFDDDGTTPMTAGSVFTEKYDTDKNQLIVYHPTQVKIYNAQSEVTLNEEGILQVPKVNFTNGWTIGENEINAIVTEIGEETTNNEVPTSTAVKGFVETAISNIPATESISDKLAIPFTTDNYVTIHDVGVVVNNGAAAYYPSLMYDCNAFGEHDGYNFKCVYSVGSVLRVIKSKDCVTWTSSIAIMTGLLTVHHPSVIYNAGGFGTQGTMKYKLIYWNSSVSNLLINTMRYAESEDCINWVNDQALTQDVTRPIISGQSGDYNGGTWGFHKIIYNPNAVNSGTNPFDYSYTAYYDCTTGTTYETTGLAYSPDCKNWIRYGDGPVLNRNSGDSGAYDYYTASFSTVWRDINGYHMYYTCGIATTNTDNYGWAYASSPDGLVWTKYASNPLMTVADGVTYRNQRCYTPSCVDDGNGTIYIIYTAVGTANSSAKTLALATLKYQARTESLTSVRAAISTIYQPNQTVDTTDSPSFEALTLGNGNTDASVEKLKVIGSLTIGNNVLRVELDSLDETATTTSFYFKDNEVLQLNADGISVPGVTIGENTITAITTTVDTSSSDNEIPSSLAVWTAISSASSGRDFSTYDVNSTTYSIPVETCYNIKIVGNNPGSASIVCLPDPSLVNQAGLTGWEVCITNVSNWAASICDESAVEIFKLAQGTSVNVYFSNVNGAWFYKFNCNKVHEAVVTWQSTDVYTIPGIYNYLITGPCPSTFHLPLVNSSVEYTLMNKSNGTLTVLDSNSNSVNSMAYQRVTYVWGSNMSGTWNYW